MLNTNVISHDELVFSDEYINENPKIIVTFLKETFIIFREKRRYHMLITIMIKAGVIIFTVIFLYR